MKETAVDVLVLDAAVEETESKDPADPRLVHFSLKLSLVALL